MTTTADNPVTNAETRSNADELRRRVSAGTVIRQREPMAKHTTLHVGGPADLWVEPANEHDLSEVLRWCNETSVPVMFVGRGSNLLVRDGGIRGVVINLGQPGFAKVVVEGSQLRCGAGARLKTVAVEARRKGLGRLEFLEGIPGSVGGALRMNAGAHGSAIFDVVEEVRVLDTAGSACTIPARDLAAEYRSCPRLQAQVAVEALLRGQPGSPEQIERRMKEFNQRRWSTQPAAPSAGCAFKNPQRIPAGRLVDELGLKGTRVGGAMVSLEHGNFIVTDNTATAADVLDLLGLITRQARSERGIELETEVQIVGTEEPQS